MRPGSFFAHLIVNGQTKISKPLRDTVAYTNNNSLPAAAFSHICAKVLPQKIDTKFTTQES